MTDLHANADDFQQRANSFALAVVQKGVSVIKEKARDTSFTTLGIFGTDEQITDVLNYVEIHTTHECKRTSPRSLLLPRILCMKISNSSDIRGCTMIGSILFSSLSPELMKSLVNSSLTSGSWGMGHILENKQGVA